MKKFYLFIFLALLIQTTASSQTCLPEGITFVLQQQIDEFTTDHPNCTEIEGDVTISGGWDLDSLYKITRIGGFLSILDNDEIDDFVGLDSLKSIGGYFKIFGCEDLDDLSGLESLTSIGGDLEIVSNYNYFNQKGLDNLTGLSSLNSIGGHLYIRYNQYLNDITGLLGLTSIGNSGIWIQENSDLISLHGLDNIDYNTISDIQIFSNSNLSECAVKSVCDFLNSSQEITYIYSNDPGCNSSDEVKEKCISSTIDRKFEGKVKLFPNPAKDILNISFPGYNNILDVLMYNSLGQIKLFKTSPGNKIDISMLENGIYIIEIRMNDKVYRKNIILNR
jgi:hypothetical protein